MSWFETKLQRRKNRGERGSQQRKTFLEGHQRRSTGFGALVEKKTGEVIAVARHGCFGRLKGLDDDLYEAWALGTRGSSL